MEIKSVVERAYRTPVVPKLAPQNPLEKPKWKSLPSWAGGQRGVGAWLADLSVDGHSFTPEMSTWHNLESPRKQDSRRGCLDHGGLGLQGTGSWWPGSMGNCLKCLRLVQDDPGWMWMAPSGLGALVKVQAEKASWAMSHAFTSPFLILGVTWPAPSSPCHLDTHTHTERKREGGRVNCELKETLSPLSVFCLGALFQQKKWSWETPLLWLAH